MKTIKLLAIVVVPLLVVGFLFHDHIQDFVDQSLINAAQSNNVDRLQSMVRLGADVNTTDDNGLTPLIWSAILGNADMARTLVDNGADVNARNFNGDTALMWASVLGHEKVVELLLTTHIDIDAVEPLGGSTALMAAAAKGRAGTVKLLLAHEASLKATDSNGRTALDYAGLNGQTKVMEAFLAAGVEFNNVRPTGIATAMIYLGANEQPTDIELFYLGRQAGKTVGFDKSALALELDANENYSFALDVKQITPDQPFSLEF